MRSRFVPYFAGLLSGLLTGGILWLILSQPRGAPVTLLPPPSPSPLRIHVAGAVRAPGVYSLPAGSLVEQAIEAVLNWPAQPRLRPRYRTRYLDNLVDSLQLVKVSRVPIQEMKET